MQTLSAEQILAAIPAAREALQNPAGLPKAPPRPPECPRCKGAGWLMPQRPVGHPEYGRAVPCECFRRERQERQALQLLDVAGLKNAMYQMTFETFDPSQALPPPRKMPPALLTNPYLKDVLEEEWQDMLRSVKAAGGHVRHLQQTVRLCQDWVSSPRRWLVLIGPTGTGKTHLAAGIVNARLDQGLPVLFAVLPDLLDWLRRGFNPQAPAHDDFEARFEAVKNHPFLVLDDFGTERVTDWVSEKLFQLVNHRHNADLPTVVTTNTPLCMIEARIASRMQEGAWIPGGPAVVRPVFAGDYRKRRGVYTTYERAS